MKTDRMPELGQFDFTLREGENSGLAECQSPRANYTVSRNKFQRQCIVNYHLSLFIAILFFRQLPSQLTERNSTKTGDMLESPSQKIGAKIFFGFLTTSRLNGEMNIF